MPSLMKSGLVCKAMGESTSGGRAGNIIRATKSSCRKCLMFWGMIKGDGTKVLLKCPAKYDAHAYIQTLSDAGVGSFSNTGHILVDDNCLVHRAHVVRNWKILLRPIGNPPIAPI